MTKVRAPMTFGLAIKTVVGVLGPDHARQIVGRSKRTLEYWEDTDKPTLPTLDQAIALDTAFIAAGGGFAPILESYERQLNVSLTESFACRSALADDINAVAREMADAIGTSVRVIEPGACPKTIYRAVAEAEEAITALTVMLARLKSFLPRNPAVHDGEK